MYYKAGEHEAKNGSDMDEGAFAFAMGLYEFVGIDALELALGKLLVALETVADAATHQTLGTLGADTAYTKDNNTFLGNEAHCLIAQK